MVGHQNVGKETLFSKVCDAPIIEFCVPGIKVKLQKAILKGSDRVIYNAPGANSIFSDREESRMARSILVPGLIEDRIQQLVLVADAKNLKRSIALALQYAEFGLPTLFNLNMVDECAKLGIRIDTRELSALLGVSISQTVAISREGFGQFLTRAGQMRVPGSRVLYPDSIERFLDIVEKLMPSQEISSRAVGLLLLYGDEGIKRYISARAGEEVLSQLLWLAAESEKNQHSSFAVRVGQVYNKKAEEIVHKVVTQEPIKENWLAKRVGHWCATPMSGVPIALAVLLAMYYFVGSFGATYVVDNINATIFEGVLFPAMEKVVAPIPSPFLRDLIMDPDFGVMTTGVFLALGLVLPVIFCFYLAFGVLEESGYIQRLSILFDRAFKKIGLNGSGVIPIIMGFSCVTMAILTTRVLNSEKEKNIASFLLFLAMPCSPLLAVMLIILNKQPLSASILVFGVIFSQMIVAGYLTNKILPGEVTPLLLEMPQMRLPNLFLVLKGAVRKSYLFMKEALPIFVLAALLIFLFQRSGGLRVLEAATGPYLDSILGLPEKSVQVFIKTIVRRESGATELLHLMDIYTNLQLVTAMIVMIFIAPCINAIIVLFKERGPRAAFSIMIAVTLYAVIIGSLVHHTCRFLGVDFT